MKEKQAKYRILHLSDLHLINTECVEFTEKWYNDLFNLAKELYPSLLGGLKNDCFKHFIAQTLYGNEYNTIISFIRRLDNQVKVESDSANKSKYDLFKANFSKLKNVYKKRRLEKMIASFEEYKTENPRFDIIVITGDIFDQGLKNDALKSKSIQKLLATISSMSDYIYLAYGNHDMNLFLKDEGENFHINNEYTGKSLTVRSDGKLVYCYVNKTEVINNYKDYNKVISAIINPDLRGKPDTSNVFAEIKNIENDIFIDIASVFDPLKRGTVNKGFDGFGTCDKAVQLSTTGVSFVNDNIAVVVLNSAWLNLDSNLCHGQLIIGRPIVSGILEQLKTNHFIDDEGKSQHGKYIITLLHNDFNWHSFLDHHFNLIETDSILVAEKNNKPIQYKSTVQIIINLSDIILTGHEHKETAPTLLGLEAYVLKVGGTFRTIDFYSDNTFSVYDLDFVYNTISRDVYNYECDNEDSDWKWQKQEDDIFVTELKPNDARSKFKNPHRLVEDCYKNLINNNLLPITSPIDYEEYMQKLNEFPDTPFVLGTLSE